MTQKIDVDKAVLMAAFARIHVWGLAIAMGTVWALMIFSATAILIIKGAPSGVEVGPNLALIGIYLPDYTVSWSGAIIGAAYLWVIGAVFGFVLAMLWNLTHYLFITAVVVRAAWWKLMAD
ncbi:MAG: hypothetical protein GXP23_11525 [Gammaproteobacteria bacterium]|nr:hypothetical protein [Gammaproteobacteria bacterium]